MNPPSVLTIADVLPHADPMCLLDELHSHGDEHVVCGIDIRVGTTFCNGVNGVPAWVGLEYMAQACSAFSGIEQVRAGGRPSICLLLGSRSYETEVEWFRLGARLQVRADLQFRGDNDLVAFACSICEGDRLLARGDIKAYRPGDLHTLIQSSR